MTRRIDTLIRAETPEGIALAIRPAGLAVRCTAFLIDGAIRFAAVSILEVVLAAGGRFGTGPMLVVFFVFNWLYFVIFELLPTAATPGKWMMGLQVIMVNGLPLTPAGALLRNLMRAVDLLPFAYAAGILSILLRADARRLGDLVAGTLVTYRARPKKSEPVPEGTPLRPVVLLSARQQAAIATFAWRSATLSVERAEEIAQLAAPAVAPGLTTEPVSSRLVSIGRWIYGERGAAPPRRG